MPRRRGLKRPQKLKTSKLSLMVLHRIKDTMELVSSIESYRPQLVTALAERYAPHLLEGETPPDHGLVVDLLARELKASLGELMERDDTAAFGTVDHEDLRQKRKLLIDTEIYPRVVVVRGAIELAFGHESGRLLHGIEGRTERQPEALEQQLQRALLLLRDSGRTLPPPKNPHAPVDRAGWIRQLESPRGDLARLNREFKRSEKAFATLVKEKQEAMAAFDATYADALRYLRAIFRMMRIDARALKNLKPYYQRRRLSQRARKARDTRAAVAAATGEAKAGEAKAGGTKAGGTRDSTRLSAAKEAARVAVPKAVARWLEQTRLFGS